ncbi:hypothetical protein E2562_020303 [Oryza meyeriana var. granulata]|uniref:Uncharacterized protein n=1 Tax=Oryza meyeriana var. granulata TaxID=110450 RepID=A0A6G1EAR4_9ORYZ|nr:hypothetical protein E2562_020303 [Oryza meyeriana var. granulata]
MASSSGGAVASLRPDQQQQGYALRKEHVDHRGTDQAISSSFSEKQTSKRALDQVPRSDLGVSTHALGREEDVYRGEEPIVAGEEELRVHRVLRQPLAADQVPCREQLPGNLQ